jgi:hypothetical protein
MIRHGLFSLPLVKNKMNFIKYTEGDQRLKKGSAAFGVVAGAGCAATCPCDCGTGSSDASAERA